MGKTLLSSWKEIALYLGRTEKTCRRWEKDLGLPVHRLEDSPRARVFAFKEEVDAWLISGGSRVLSSRSGRRGAGRGGRRIWTGVIAAAVIGGLALAGILIRKPRGDEPWYPGAVPFRSIAVLPFTDLSPGSEWEYLADGMTDALIDALCGIPGLRVPARTSCFYFKGKDASLDEISRKLRADALLEGSLQVEEDKLKLAARLIKAADGSVLWSRTYQEPLDDLFALQDGISREVADALEIDGFIFPAGFSGRGGFAIPRAYQVFLKGWFFLHHGDRSEARLERAVRFFEEAVALDPSGAPAFAALSEAWLILPNYGSFPRETAYRNAGGAARKALALDPDSPEAHVAYGMYLSEAERDRRGEIEQFMEAIRLKPGYGWAHHMYATSLLYLGRAEEALEEVRRALDLDPFSCVVTRDLGVFLYLTGRYQEAIEAFVSALQLYPDHWVTHYYRGCAFLELGMYRSALDSFRKISRNEPILSKIYKALTLARKRDFPEANRILSDLLQRTEAEPSTQKNFHMAALLLNLGRKEEGYRYLRESERCRDQQLGFLKIHPLFQAFRHDPEFREILGRLALD